MAQRDAPGDGGHKFAVDLPRRLFLRRTRPLSQPSEQPDIQERVARMRQFEVFVNLPDAPLQKLAAAANFRVYRMGESLWQQDEPTSQVLFIERGLAKTSRRIRAGLTRTYGLYGPGDSMGIYAIWAGMKYPTDAIALSEGMMGIVLPPKILMDCSRRQPLLSASLVSEIGHFTEAFIHKIEIVSAGSIAERIATFLAMLVDRYGSETAEGTAELPIYLTLEHISEIVDARIETVARVLSEWKRQAWLILDADGFHFLRFDQVRALLPDQAAT